MTRDLLPVREITRGPKHHWFGYYDKLQFDTTGRFVLGMEVDFNGRSPNPEDVIKVGMVDIQNDDRWIEFGESRAWCWQQGCMLQWRPASETEVIWNDRHGDRFVSHIYDVISREKRTLPHPIYTISPDGRTALAPDFRRLNNMRPGYGYAGIPDPYEKEKAPATTGIWQINLNTGETRLILSYADVYGIPYRHGDYSNTQHWFNHLLYNQDGSRFIFLHRWRTDDGGFNTRLMTSSPDGRDIHIVDDYGEASHFIWRDPTHILAWAHRPPLGWRFYLYEDGTDKVEVVGEGVMTENGHCIYLPGENWILNDTYPDITGKQHLYLYHVGTGRKVPVHSFLAPKEYRGEWRCDLHPRFSRDGRFICIDSAHESTRQMYLLDIGDILP